ncbi:MAG: signal recognition particle protein [Vicinamibacteria bacterium]|jgi:signal recognition particle subunit SRP54|nr:signal recognition particle protein [Vicinamibacteria bacterium]
MFDTLSAKLSSVFKSLRGQGVLSEAQVEAALREIRMALLEADVHFQVAKDFLVKVRARATGQEILKSLTPDQAVLRIVRDEMVTLLGGDTPPRLRTAARIPSIVLMVGLQGSGKTTSSAKLGAWWKKSGHHPLLVSVDVYRPAAREQLRLVGQQAGLTVHHPQGELSPEKLLQSAIQEARAVGHDLLLVDTAGRLHIDDELMAELQALARVAEPTEILFVADAMTGQDAVKSALEFRRRVEVTGIVLTKLDGDARGGAALSAAAVTGCPVKFAGTGEKIEDFELFQPERMVSRILGMGDILSLIEQAEQVVDRERAEEFARKLRRSEFSLEDYREQLKSLRKMGSLERVLSMLPGMGAVKGVDVAAGEREIGKSVAILDSMTPDERADSSLINGSRRRRIARGSGTNVEDVNRLLKQYLQARKMMKSLGGGAKAMRRLAGRMPLFH